MPKKGGTAKELPVNKLNGNSDTGPQLTEDEDEDETPPSDSKDLNLAEPTPCRLSNCNVREKIILVIDRAEDENFTGFKLNNEQINPLAMLKNSLESFLYMKQRIGSQHEMSIATLNENTTTWLYNFTSNVPKLMTAIQKLSVCETEDIFNLNSLFDVILNNVTIPEKNIADISLPPPYVVRCILFYGRSYTLPRLEENASIKELLENPFFTLDVLMTHEPEDVDNNCTKIFNIFQNLDRKGLSYFFPVARNAKMLQNSMAKLLSHPLQRPMQKVANYKIECDL